MDQEQVIEQFRLNLKALRQKAGFTQSELARRMECAPSYICDLERGRRDPTVRTLAPLSKALGVTPADLVAIENLEISKIPA